MGSADNAFCRRWFLQAVRSAGSAICGRCALVAGDGGVDRAGPLVYAAGEGLDVLEALLAEPHGDVEGAGAVMADDDGWAIVIELLEAGGDVCHGDEGGAGDGGDVDFPRLADIEQERRGGLMALGGVGVDGDLGRKSVRHGNRIAESVQVRWISSGGLTGLVAAARQRPVDAAANAAATGGAAGA